MANHPSIVIAPHQSLRQKAKPVSTFDKKIKQVIKDLSTTLLNGSERYVGLASPQIDTQWRIYVTKTEYAQGELVKGELLKDKIKNGRPEETKAFVNPRITKSSKQHDLGGDAESTPLEGCLSIPGMYGPVPRFHWIELTFETPTPEYDKLMTQTVRLHDFNARLAQHELDHLDGILFTDYTLEYRLPIYLENDTGELERITDTRIIETF